MASEIKAVLASEWIEASINEERVPEQFTFGYLAGSDTLFKGIKKLMPGHHLVYRNGQARITQYWDIPLPTDHQTSSDEDLVDEFSELFQDSVRQRMMSDVPLGVFLSGGLDSSSIASLMAREMPGQLKTFSVGFEADYYSEFDFAREVAATLDSDHHEVVLTPKAFFESLPMLTWHEDEPIRSSPSIALYHVAKLAREHVTVVLTGEGSDELFAGYDRYWATLFNMRWGKPYNAMLPKIVREQGLKHTLWKWPLPLSLKKKISHTFVGHSMDPAEIVFDNFYAIFPQRIHEAVFTPDFYARTRHVDPYADNLRFYNHRKTKNTLDRLLYTDQKTYLLELLMKQDNMSMAASIESRVPFLDHRLVEFAVNVPNRLKVRQQAGKRIVKDAMAKFLPESVRRRKKTGFPVPFNDWLKRGFDSTLKQILIDDRVEDRNILSRSCIEQLLREHQQGQRDHTEALWTMFNFEVWARMFIDGERPEVISDELMGCNSHADVPAAIG